MDNKIREQLVAAIWKYKEDLIFDDGHTIFDPEIYRKMEVPESFLEDLIKDHRSSRASVKSSIFNNRGDIMQTCWGIYNLEFLDKVIKGLEIPTKSGVLMGRGFIAGMLAQEILDHVFGGKTVKELGS